MGDSSRHCTVFYQRVFLSFQEKKRKDGKKLEEKKIERETRMADCIILVYGLLYKLLREQECLAHVEKRNRDGI